MWTSGIADDEARVRGAHAHPLAELGDGRGARDRERDQRSDVPLAEAAGLLEDVRDVAAAAAVRQHELVEQRREARDLWADRRQIKLIININ